MPFEVGHRLVANQHLRGLAPAYRRAIKRILHPHILPGPAHRSALRGLRLLAEEDQVPDGFGRGLGVYERHEILYLVPRGTRRESFRDMTQVDEKGRDLDLVEGGVDPPSKGTRQRGVSVPLGCFESGLAYPVVLGRQRSRREFGQRVHRDKGIRHQPRMPDRAP